jgi:hypothetical protein
MSFDPLHLIPDLTGRDAAYEFQTVKFNSALPAVTQENVDMRQRQRCLNAPLLKKQLGSDPN